MGLSKLGINRRSLTYANMAMHASSAGVSQQFVLLNTPGSDWGCAWFGRLFGNCTTAGIIYPKTERINSRSRFVIFVANRRSPFRRFLFPVSYSLRLPFS